MISCYIIDDEKSAAELIERFVLRTPGLSILGVECDPLNAFHNLVSGKIKPDVIFIDINMPGLLGTDLAAQVTASTKIVFTSAMSNYAIKAFDIGATDFLEKPISYDRFLQTIKRLHQATASDSSREVDSFFIKGNRKGIMQRIELKKMIYIESDHNYSYVYMADGSKNIVYLSLQEMEIALPQKDFLRVHKSFIVNLSMIERIEGNLISLRSSNQTIACGIQYKDIFRSVVQDRLLGRKK